MKDNPRSNRWRRRIRPAILIVVSVALVALAIHEIASVYTAGRRVQDAADAAAVAGARQLARTINQAKDAQHLEQILSDSSLAEGEIEAEMQDLIFRNGIVEDYSAAGYYLDDAVTIEVGNRGRGQSIVTTNCLTR